MKHVLFDSEYCSMGRWIAIAACHKLGISFYDDKKLASLVDDEVLMQQEIDALNDILMETSMTAEELSEDVRLQKVQAVMTTAVQEAIKSGSCMIHERGCKADFPDSTEVISVLVYNSSMADKRKRALFDDRYAELGTGSTGGNPLQRGQGASSLQGRNQRRSSLG